MFRRSVLIGNIPWSVGCHLISVLSNLFNGFFQMHASTQPRSTGTFALNNPPPTVLRNITLNCHLHVFKTTGAAYHANIRDSTTTRGHYKAKPLRISTRKRASIKIKKRLPNFNKLVWRQPFKTSAYNCSWSVHHSRYFHNLIFLSSYGSDVKNLTMLLCK